MDTAAIESAITPVLRGLDVDLYDLELVGRGRGRILRVSIDRPGGIDLSAIEAVNREISPVLDRLDAVPGTYTLEVSSPGLERHLRTPAHFRNAGGQLVSCKVRDGESTTRVRGIITDSDSKSVTLQIESESQKFLFTDVISARTVFEWKSKEKKAS